MLLPSDSRAVIKDSYSDFFLNFTTSAGADRNNMHRVDNIQQTLLILDDHIVLTYQNEFRVRDDKLPSVGSANGEGAAPGQLLADQHGIHAVCIAPWDNSVKRMIGESEEIHQCVIGGTYDWGLPAGGAQPAPLPDAPPSPPTTLDTDGRGGGGE